MRCCQNDAVNEQWQSAAEKIYSCLEPERFWVCNFPTRLAEGLIKHFKNVSLLFYLLEGKGYVNQPWVVYPKQSLSFSKKQNHVI